MELTRFILDSWEKAMHGGLGRCCHISPTAPRSAIPLRFAGVGESSSLRVKPAGQDALARPARQSFPAEEGQSGQMTAGLNRTRRIVAHLSLRDGAILERVLSSMMDGRWWRRETGGPESWIISSAHFPISALVR